MKKIFVFCPDNVIDLITNSSSELFVLEGNTKKEVEEMIESVYPGYLGEYHGLKSISDLDIHEMRTYLDYACHTWGSRPVPLPGYTFDEMFEKNPDKEDRFERYVFKNNVKDPRDKWDRSFVTEENLEEVKSKMDPSGKMFFLFSIDDNPNWDMQEALMNIGSRYHLG